MLARKLLILILILCTLIIPLIQLSIGFYYVDLSDQCRLAHDIPLLMSIGGVFQLIFFAAAFACVYAITPGQYKLKAGKPTNRWSQRLIAGATVIFGTCAMIFFVLLQVRVYGNFRRVQGSNSTLTTYCDSNLFSSAVGLMISTYVAFIFLVIVAVLLLLGIGVKKQ